MAANVAFEFAFTLLQQFKGRVDKYQQFKQKQKLIAEINKMQNNKSAFNNLLEMNKYVKCFPYAFLYLFIKYKAYSIKLSVCRV